VIAVRLSSKDSDVLDANTSAYFNRSSFKSYSNAMDDEPYIAAEIGAQNYPATFVLGDDSSTSSISDFNDLDTNGPLEEGKYYSFFVRIFSTRPAVSPHIQ